MHDRKKEGEERRKERKKERKKKRRESQETPGGWEKNRKITMLLPKNIDSMNLLGLGVWGNGD